jgi:hypothetical protein
VHALERIAAVEPAALARKLIATAPGTAVSAKLVADLAGRAAIRFSQHLSRLVGDTGIRSLVHRSIMVAGETFPWLTMLDRAGEADPCVAMRMSMEKQSAETAAEAFVLVWTTFVGLLGKLIGANLVERLLHEIWPTHVHERRQDPT